MRINPLEDLHPYDCIVFKRKTDKKEKEGIIVYKGIELKKTGDTIVYFVKVHKPLRVKFFKIYIEDIVKVEYSFGEGFN